jgi:hypothetical protein
VDNVRTGLGTGASGGLGAGLAAVGATLKSRFDVFLDSGIYSTDFDAKIADVDLVITAEGSIDFQTPHGKVPAEVARRAARAGVPVMGTLSSVSRHLPYMPQPMALLASSDGVTLRQSDGTSDVVPTSTIPVRSRRPWLTSSSSILGSRFPTGASNTH